MSHSKLYLPHSLIFFSFSLLSTIGASIPATAQEKQPVEISVYGALGPLGLDRLGKPVSSLDKQDIQQSGSTTIGELLASEPGISSSSFGPAASRPVIRGQSQQRVRVLENGLESGDVSDVSDDHAVSVDLSGATRVDVLRGPSTLLYGSSAIGGVVNIIDNGIPEFRAERAATGSIQISKGDRADDQNVGSFALSGDAGAVTWYGSGFYRETDNLRIPGLAESERLRAQEAAEGASDDDAEQTRGILENSDLLSKGAKLGASYVWNRGFIGLSVQKLDSEYGIPGHHHEHHDEAEHEPMVGQAELAGMEDEEVLPRIDLDQLRIESRGRLELDSDYFHATSFALSYSDYEHKELEGGAIGTLFEKDSFEGRFELNHGHEDQSEGAFGAQVRYDDFAVSGDEAYLPNSRTVSPALFSIHDFVITDRLRSQLGGRYEHSAIEADTEDSKNFNLINFSAGTSYTLGSEKSYILGATTSYSERAPSTSELFANGAHLASQTFEIGDGRLDKERSIGAELFARKIEGRASGSVSIFTQYYPDYISLSPTGTEDEDLPVYRYEATSARFWGFEGAAEYRLFGSLESPVSLYGKFDYVRARDTQSNDPLPRITPLRGTVGVRYELGELSTFIEGVFVREQDRVAQFELPTDGYTLLNIGASYMIATSESHRYEFSIRGTNLTDEEARMHTSFLKDVAPLRGRAFLAGLSVSF